MRASAAGAWIGRCSSSTSYGRRKGRGEQRSSTSTLLQHFINKYLTPTEAQLIYESPQTYHRVDVRFSLSLEIAHYLQNGCYVQHRREAGRITRRMSSIKSCSTSLHFQPPASFSPLRRVQSFLSDCSPSFDLRPPNSSPYVPCSPKSSHLRFFHQPSY
jgi:hypothetical protein